MAVAILVAAAAFGIHSYRYRFVRTNADLFRYLPDAGFTSFYADVEALRRTGNLTLLTGTKTIAEPEYQEFVKQAQFDYAKDVNAIAGASNGEVSLILARGQFGWEDLRRYAIAHGGSCEGDVCSVRGAREGRWISFVSIQPDVIGVALSANRRAARELRGTGHKLREPVPVFPIWIRVSPELLQHPERLPSALRIFGISLQSAERVLLSLAGAGGNGGAAFDLRLEATFRNKAAAETVRTQFEIQTKMLVMELAREHAQANAADLTGLLTGGRFEVAGKQVVGIWPVRQELLKALQ